MSDGRVGPLDVDVMTGAVDDVVGRVGQGLEAPVPIFGGQEAPLVGLAARQGQHGPVEGGVLGQEDVLREGAGRAMYAYTPGLFPTA